MNKSQYLSFLTQHKEKWQNATPCFVINKAQLSETLTTIKRLLPGEILYSHKTNPHSAITQIVKDHKCGFLLSSVEESEDLIRNEGVIPENLMFQSPSMTMDQYKRVQSLGVSRFIIDSREQLQIILSSLEGMARKPEILVRINTGVKISGSELPYSTDSYLGFPISEVTEVFRELDAFRKQGKITLGLHNHLLSQNTFLDLWQKNLGVMADYVESLKTAGIELDIVDFGGGYPITYKSEAPSLESISEIVIEATGRMKQSYPNIRFIFEPGRKVVGESITLVAGVSHVKEFLKTNVAILNCSVYNASMDTLIVGLFLPADKVVLGDEVGPRREYVLRGSTPDSLDVFSKKIELPELVAGDSIAFFHAGAYSFWSDFISLKKPEHIVI